jgi:hypothetical protein
VRNVKVLATVIATSAALGACGGSDDGKEPSAVSGDQRGVLSTVDALQSASRQGDVGRICDDLFTEALAKSIQEASKHSCEDEVRGTLASPDARFSVEQNIVIEGSSARATIREQNGNTSTVDLTKQEGRWRIARVTPAQAE